MSCAASGQPRPAGRNRDQRAEPVPVVVVRGEVEALKEAGLVLQVSGVTAGQGHLDVGHVLELAPDAFPPDEGSDRTDASTLAR